MRVLITGGYGFLGAWIIRRLLADGAQPFVYDLRADERRSRQIVPAERLSEVTFVPGNVTDQATLSAALATHGITHVIHLAGLQVPTCRANPILGAQVNVQGTLAVLEAVSRAQPRPQLVYASSAAVFGPPSAYPAGPLDDNVQLSPSTHYGYFKCCNEGNARIYWQDHQLPSVGLRPWTVYGVGRDLGMTSEPTKAIKAVVVGRKYHISFGGITDFQLADDVAAAFIRGVTQPSHGAPAYNLRGAVVDMASFHRELCAVAPAAEQLVTFGTQQIAIAYNLSDAAWQRDFGPLPPTPLRTGIAQTFAHFQQLHQAGLLDTADLDAAPAPVVADEP
jgi:nucleoside-diphosphate-sugar epimerase